MRIALAFCALLFLSVPASAQLQCGMAVSTIDFGSIDPLRTTSATAIGTVSVNCGLLGVVAPAKAERAERCVPGIRPVPRCSLFRALRFTR
jgi:hypothetical protein